MTSENNKRTGAEAKRHRILCNKCNRKTWHALRGEHSRSYNPDNYPEMQIDWAETRWEIWQCQGCDEVVFREASTNSEDRDPNTGEFECYETLYPNRSAETARKKEYHHIPEALDAIYGEVVSTFNTGSQLLCAGGLRALLEGICADKKIKSGPDSKGKTKKNLEGRINKLSDYVPPNIVGNLHGFRFLGNSALHELDPPDRETLALAIEVIEDVLAVVYDLDYKSARLFQMVSDTSKNKEMQVDF